MVDRINHWPEQSSNRNTRLLGHRFLQKVLFNGEPVVPKIITESNIDKSRFDVEKLDGVDLDDLIKSGIQTRSGLDVIIHVTEQLQVIDKSGILLFDRDGRNIRILSWAGSISTRQIDLEDFYDHRRNVLYCDKPSREEDKKKLLNDCMKFGFNIWSREVVSLAEMTMKVIGDRNPLINRYTNFLWRKKEPVLFEKDLLKVFKKDVEQMFPIYC